MSLLPDFGAEIIIIYPKDKERPSQDMSLLRVGVRKNGVWYSKDCDFNTKGCPCWLDNRDKEI